MKSSFIFLNRTLLFGIIFLLFFSFISADMTAQFNKDYDLKRPCFNNGTYCSSSSNCNITLVYPDGNLLLDNQVMNNKFSFHNVTIPQSSINQLGIIFGIMSCADGSLYGEDTFDLYITADGKEPKTFPIELSITVISLIMILSGSFNDRLSLIKTSGSILLMVMGIITIYPGYSFINYSTLPGLGIGTISIGIGFYFLISDSFSRNKQKGRYNRYPDGLEINDETNYREIEEEEDDGRYHDNY